MQSYDYKIKSIVEKLINFYKPDLILLFGSAANEIISEDSDVDLLIVKETEKHPIWRRVEVRKIIKADLPMDIIVLTPDEFQELKQSGSMFIKDILKNGKILYEKESISSQVS